MTISAEERSAINRKNAMASTGPKSDEGKRKVSRNAFKHGMRAETIALPNEDPDAIRDRADQWDEACRPANALESYLLEQAVKASLSLDRCRAQHTALLARQVREAPDAWEHAKQDEVQRLVALLETDPAAALRQLERSAHGCRWLMDRWARLDAILESDGRWCGPDRDEAIRLLGLRPEPDNLKDSEGAFKVRLFNLLCLPDRADRCVDWLFDPARMPESLRSTYRVDFLPDPADSLAALREMVVERYGPLEALERRLRTELDEPDRAEAATRALVPLGEGPARLALRYQTTAENSFYRAYNALKKEQKARESGGAGEPVGAAVERAVVAADEPAAAPESPPNQADPAVPIQDEDPVSPTEESPPNKANAAAPIPAEDPASPAPRTLPNKANAALPNKANAALPNKANAA